MTEKLLIALIALCVIMIFVLIYILIRMKKSGNPAGYSSLIREKDEAQLKVLDRSAAIQRERLEDLERRIEENTKTNDLRISQMRAALEENLRYLSGENAKQLSAMREVVDEKLSSTLEKRLNDSFELISGRLEAVSKGIGEVQSLAAGVSDIKRLFANIKVRGTWGEVQLENLLDQILSAEQYVKNVRIKQFSEERVDFAVVIPGKDMNTMLPIDSKFPAEEYLRLQEAAESSDKAGIERAEKGLFQRLKEEADKISEKYINPPVTTDFAVMYLPTEGLYAETVKNTALLGYLHSKKIMACGPNSLGALLNSLQTGFKSITIERKSAELWKLLSVFKQEFTKFNELLIKAGGKLEEVERIIDAAAKKSAAIDRKLSAADMPEAEQTELFFTSD